MARATNDDGWTTRSVEINPHGYDSIHGYVVEVVLTDWEETTHGDKPQGRRKVGQFAFVRLDHAERAADSVRGERPDTEGTPVTYIGDSFGKHYYQSHSHEDIPVDVFEALSEDGLDLVTGVGGGWSNWDGRPEWSESYLGYDDAEVVDLGAEIADRREDTEDE